MADKKKPAPPVLPPDFDFGGTPDTLPADFSFEAPNAGLASPGKVPVPAELQKGVPAWKSLASGAGAQLAEVLDNYSPANVKKNASKIGLERFQSLQNAPGPVDVASNFVGAPEFAEGNWAGGVGRAGTNVLLAYLLNKAGGKPAQTEMGSVAGDALANESAKVFGSTGRAGTKFQEVMGQAKDVPIDLQKVQGAIDRAVELNQRGQGTIPTPMRMFIKRMAKVNELGPITYEEARDFYNSAGYKSMSIKDQQNVTPMMKRELNNFRKGIGSANYEAADSVGQAQNYNDAMQMYRRAMKTQEIGKYATKAAGTAALGYGGYKVIGSLADMLKK